MTVGLNSAENQASHQPRSWLRCGLFSARMCFLGTKGITIAFPALPVEIVEVKSSETEGFIMFPLRSAYGRCERELLYAGHVGRFK